MLAPVEGGCLADRSTGAYLPGPLVTPDGRGRSGGADRGRHRPGGDRHCHEPAREPPRSRSGGGSFEFCPSCGFQFGVSDDDAGFTCESWRGYWQEGGRRWASQATPVPPDWDSRMQLENLRRRPRGRRKNSPKSPSRRPR